MSPGEESECHGESESPIATPTPRSLQWALAKVGNGYGGKQKWAGRLVPVLPAGRTATTGFFFTRVQSDGGLPTRPDRGSRGGAEWGAPHAIGMLPRQPPNSKAKRPLGLNGSLLAVLFCPAWG